MKNVPWHILEVAAQLLERREREAVLGDLTEASEGAWRGFVDVVGLVIRRQASLWKEWRPWLAAFGVAVPTSFLLMGFSLSVSVAWRRCVGAGLLGSAGRPASADILQLLCQVSLLAGWAWCSGFLVGSVSRRTLWASLISYCAPCLFCLARFRIESLSRFCLLLFVLPAVVGVYQGRRLSQIRAAVALAIAVAVTVLVIPTRQLSGQTWWSLSALLVNLTLTWPAWFLVATAWKKAAVSAPPSAEGPGKATT